MDTGNQAELWCIALVKRLIEQPRVLLSRLMSEKYMLRDAQN